MAAQVAGITPAPSDEEAAAIVAAIELLWPQPQAAPDPAAGTSGWRFSGRRWQQSPTWPRRQY